MSDEIMERLKSEKGLTLLEVIISIAIIGIISTAFLSLFGNSFVSIASFGEKSEDLMSASDVLEQVYLYNESYTEDTLKVKLEGLSGDQKSDVSIDASVTEGKKFNYYFTDASSEVSGKAINGFKLTVAFPNASKGEMEKLTSFIPGVN